MTATESGEWKKTACILCAVNCGLEVQTAGSTSCASAATRPTRSRRVTCARSRSAWTTTRTAPIASTAPMRRRADGSYERIDWATAIREIAAKLRGIRDQHGGESDPVLRRRQPGQSPWRHLRRQHAQGARREVPLQCARPGKDRRSVGAGQDDGQRHPRRLRALRSGRVRRQEPVAVARLRAHADAAAGDSQRSGPRVDRHRSAAQRDGGHGGLPPRRAPGHRRLVPGGAGRAHRAGRTRGAGVARRAHHGLCRHRADAAVDPGGRVRAHLRRGRVPAASGRASASHVRRAFR